jgi:hypothetical protein
MNNPISFLDGSGYEIDFPEGTTEEFKTTFYSTWEHLSDHGVGYILDELDALEEKVYIEEGSAKNDFYFRASTNTITWNPKYMMLTTTGNLLSPATLLNHEAGHSLRFNNDKEGYLEDRKKGSDAEFNTIEERRVIEGIEQETAVELDEIKEGETTRPNHKGTFFPYIPLIPIEGEKAK